LEAKKLGAPDGSRRWSSSTNSASSRRNHGFAGWLVQRDIGKYLMLGTELVARLLGSTFPGFQKRPDNQQKRRQAAWTFRKPPSG
jgi:hypothetical protein